MFPCASFQDTNKLSYTVTPSHPVDFIIPNVPVNFNDAEFAQCLESRTSYYCVIITVLGVVVYMKVKKTGSIMTHTTDSKLKTNFEGSRALLPVWAIFSFMKCPLKDPSILFVDNKVVHNIISSGRMTPQCCHFDIPIAFLHASRGSVFELKLITTDKMLADMGTKATTPALLKHFKDWACGARFYPDKKHKHFQLLQLQFCEKCFVVILKEVDQSCTKL